MEERYHIILLAFAIYSTVLSIFGCITNLLCSITCLFSCLNKQPTFVFIGVIAIFDTLFLIIYTLNVAIEDIVGFQPFIYNIVSLKLCTFVGYSAAELSSTLLIIMAIERMLTIKIKKWRKLYFNSKTTLILIVIVFILICLMNIPIFLVNVSQISNNTMSFNDTITQFFQSNIMLIYTAIAPIFQTIVPIPILLLVNPYLIYKIISKGDRIERNRENKRKRLEISVSVAVMTMLFVLLNTIVAVVLLLRPGSEGITESWYVAYKISSSLQSTFYATSFVLLYKTNESFRKEFHIIFKTKSSNRITPTSIERINNTMTTRK